MTSLLNTRAAWGGSGGEKEEQPRGSLVLVLEELVVSLQVGLIQTYNIRRSVLYNGAAKKFKAVFDQATRAGVLTTNASAIRRSSHGMLMG